MAGGIRTPTVAGAVPAAQFSSQPWELSAAAMNPTHAGSMSHCSSSWYGASVMLFATEYAPTAAMPAQVIHVLVGDMHVPGTIAALPTYPHVALDSQELYAPLAAKLRSKPSPVEKVAQPGVPSQMAMSTSAGAVYGMYAGFRPGMDVTATVPLNPFHYAVLNDTEIYDAQIPGSSLQNVPSYVACAIACAATPTCVGFSHNRLYWSCTMHATVSNFDPSDDRMAGNDDSGSMA